MPDEESLSREVEEARLNLIAHFEDHNCGKISSAVTEELDDLVAAVRKQERARIEREYAANRRELDNLRAFTRPLAAPVEGGEG